MSVTFAAAPVADMKAAARAGDDPADYLPAPALRIYDFVSQNGPCTDYAIRRGADASDGLSRYAWLNALVDLGLLRECTVRGERPEWIAVDREARATAAPEAYLPAPALRIYSFLQQNGPSTLLEVRKAHPLPGFGTLSWLLCLKDVGLATQRQVKVERRYEFVWDVVA